MKTTLLRIDHRLVNCTVKATGQHWRVTPISDAGHYENTDRKLQMIGMSIRNKWNTRGSALVAIGVLDQIRAN
jgi:hypothetical protein